MNLLFIYFLLIFFSIFINTNTSLHLLLTAELLWITLYAIALTIAYIYDNLNLLALTFFFLVLSAVEFGIGIVLILLQNTVNRTISLSNNDLTFTKFSKRFKTKLFLNKINWKF